MILNTYFPIFLDIETERHSFSYVPNAGLVSSHPSNRSSAKRYPCYSDDPFVCYFPDESATGVIRSAEPRTRGFYIFITIFCINLIQLLLLFSLASFAYFGNNRKRIFMALGLISCLFGVALVFTYESTLACTICFVLISAFVSTANMFSQSFYHSLVQNHPEVTVTGRDTMARAEAVERVSNTISSTAFFYSYSASSLQLVFGGVVAFLVYKSEVYSDGFSLLLGIGFSGIWGFVCLLGFTSNTLIINPGPSLPENESKYWITWKRYRQTWTEVKKFPCLRKFLRAWLVFNLAFANLSNFAFFYIQNAAKLSFGMSLIAAAVLTVMTGFGSYYGPVLQSLRYFQKISPKWKFIVQIILFTGYSVIVTQRATLREGTAIFILIPYGFMVGSLRASVFTLYSDLIPTGYEQELFILLDVNEIFGSMIGALIASNGGGSLVVTLSFAIVMFISVLMFSFIKLEDAKVVVARFNENQKFVPLRELTGLAGFKDLPRV